MKNIMDKSVIYNHAAKVQPYEVSMIELSGNAAELSYIAAHVDNFINGEKLLAEVIAKIEIFIERLRASGLSPLIDHHKEFQLELLAKKLRFNTH